MLSPYSLISRVPEEEQRRFSQRQTLIGRFFDTLNIFHLIRSNQKSQNESFVESPCKVVGSYEFRW